MIARLTGTDGLPDAVAIPKYVPADHGVGIVHIGPGAFHRAHQAVYTDDALALAGGDWRITGVSLRSTTAARELTPQNGLYTLIVRGAEGSLPRIIGSVEGVLSATEDRGRVLEALTAPETRMVSLTVTEKAYGMDRATGGVDTAHAAIAADLSDPDHPQGVAGLLVWAIGQRLAAGTKPFTVLCCDNLPENGRMLRGLVLDFARRVRPNLVEYIAGNVAFPSTMVDRITPARTPKTLAEAQKLTGRVDLAAEETESFSQWVVEDNFPSGRPAWDLAGAIFTDDVTPYEEMKLRMLNGVHSMLAYAGFLAGYRYVRDAMADQALSWLVRRHLAAAAATLQPVAGIDLNKYGADLVKRFENRHLAHETYQIAMDGTEKLPQRILAPACDALAVHMTVDTYAFTVASWMRYVLGFTDANETYALRDPREEQLLKCVRGVSDADQIVGALSEFPGLFPEKLQRSQIWREAVRVRLDTILKRGMREAIVAEAGLRPNPPA